MLLFSSLHLHLNYNSDHYGSEKKSREFYAIKNKLKTSNEQMDLGFK